MGIIGDIWEQISVGAAYTWWFDQLTLTVFVCLFYASSETYGLDRMYDKFMHALIKIRNWM